MDSQTVLALKFEIEHKGVKYPISYRSGKIVGQFEAWAKSNAIREVLDKKKLFLDQGCSELAENVSADLKQIYSDISSADPEKNYSFNGAKCQKLLEGVEGNLYFLRLTLGEKALALSKEDFEELVFEKQEEIAALMEATNTQVTEIQRELGWDAEADPKGEHVDPKVLVKVQRRLKERGIDVL